jgi:hypothetical protein
MNSKLILTELQYSSLMKFIIETKFDKMVKNIIKVGDIIRISFKGSVNNFKVISSHGGQIQMDNIDTGSTNINFRYFITQTSLEGDDLEIRRVHKIKEKNKLTDIKSWKTINVKDVLNIEVVRNGAVVDTVDTPKPTDVKQQANREKGHRGKLDTEDFKTRVDDTILVFIHKIKEGNGLIINMVNGDVISMCCVGDESGKYTFILDSDTKMGELKKWDTFGVEFGGTGEAADEDLYELNKEVIKSTDGGKTLNIMFRGFSGEKTKDIWVKGITDISQKPTCVSEDGNIDQDDTDKSEKLKHDGKKAMDMILNDPNLKAAFYTQPTLWNLFVAELSGKEATGKGIVPTLDIINKYGRNKINDELGAEFKSGKNVMFSLVGGPISIPYRDEEDKPVKPFVLNSGTNYKIRVRDYTLGDNHTVLEDGNKKYKIIVKDKTDKEDVFNCDIIKYVDTKRGIIEYPRKNVEVLFNKESDGYKPYTD